MPQKPRWRFAEATAAGTSHIRDNLPNQDAVCHRLVKAGNCQVVVVAIADGAGSAAHSDKGSHIAVSAAVESVVNRINRKPPAAFVEHLAATILRNSIKQAKNAVVRFGKGQGVPVGELASTLIVALASERLLAAAQVGDGAVIAFNQSGGSARTLCDAHTGEYANETTFITSRTRPHKIANVGHASGSDYDSLALITDGLQNLALKMPGKEAFMGFWNPLLHDLAQTSEPEAVSGRLYSFISGERVQSRTSDDVTIAIAVQNRQSQEDHN